MPYYEKDYVFCQYCNHSFLQKNIQKHLAKCEKLAKEKEERRKERQNIQRQHREAVVQLQRNNIQHCPNSNASTYVHAVIHQMLNIN
jgi:hypothetical protein